MSKSSGYSTFAHVRAPSTRHGSDALLASDARARLAPDLANVILESSNGTELALLRRGVVEGASSAVNAVWGHDDLANRAGVVRRQAQRAGIRDDVGQHLANVELVLLEDDGFDEVADARPVVRVDVSRRVVDGRERHLDGVDVVVFQLTLRARLLRALDVDVEVVARASASDAVGADAPVSVQHQQRVLDLLRQHSLSSFVADHRRRELHVDLEHALSGSGSCITNKIHG